MKTLDLASAIEKLSGLSKSRNYWVMYSSLYGGMVTDPAAMVLPLDDHMVHRGDGVFEAFRFHSKKIFDLEGHLKRLERSSEMVGLKLPYSISKITEICEAVVEASPESKGMLRLFVSRGFGDFSPNPYSTKGSLLYVVSTPLSLLPKDKYEQGVKIGFSNVPVKPGFFSQVKSCNYLPNVLTKKESVDRGWDFALNVTESGDVAEGPTENVLVFTKENELLSPPFDYTLRGTTLLKVLEIAERLSRELGIKKVGAAPLSVAAFKSAQEIMMVGTTLGVLPVTKIENQDVGRGQVGPVARRLRVELDKIMGL